ncbi:ferredoxin--NADP reductase [Natrononativus amylolyticus]|uniref:ferredoxin--NADP reductase n=1 Tax=Natrononativus amylolyticus TaxID=2963434 RepID=UPI0020CCE103|nr:FAD-dependent oxidoreductase [Natrononativus amylolyticus]
MTLSATLTDVHRMTPDVKLFRLVVDGHTFEYEPGQHTTIHFESDGEEVTRPYTAIAQPGTNNLVLAIKRYDDGTASVYMHERSPGDEIELEPVDGNLHLRDPTRDAVFIATGTGITPLYPMLTQYARDGEGNARLVFGERDQEHLIFRESLEQLRASNATVSVEYVLSDAENDWGGRTGHVQDHLPGTLEPIEDPAAADAYVCGVPEMVVETQELLAEAGFDGDRIFTEGWESDAADG